MTLASATSVNWDIVLSHTLTVNATQGFSLRMKLSMFIAILMRDREVTGMISDS
jgi:hypothetical protein